MEWVDPDGELEFLDLLRAEAQIARFLYDDRPAIASPKRTPVSQSTPAR